MKKFLILFLMISNIAFGKCWGWEPESKFKNINLEDGTYVLGEAFEVKNINEGFKKAFNDAIIKRIPGTIKIARGYSDDLSKSKTVSEVNINRSAYDGRAYNLGQFIEIGSTYEKNPNGTYNTYVLLRIFDTSDSDNLKFKEFARKGHVADLNDVVESLMKQKSSI